MENGRQGALPDIGMDALDEYLCAEGAVPILLDLWAPWCAPCKQQNPILERLSVHAAGRVRLVKLNVEQFPQAMDRFELRGIPALLLFQKGKEVSRKGGLQTLERLQHWLIEHGIDVVPVTGGADDASPPWGGAFYGNEALKGFLVDRLAKAAAEGRLERVRSPTWTDGRGSVGAGLVEHADPEIFVRQSNLPVEFGFALHLAEVRSPQALREVFDLIPSGADLRLTVFKMLCGWLGDEAWDWPTMLGEEAELLRQSWLSNCNEYLAGTTASSAGGEAVQSLARTTVSSDPYRSLQTHFAQMLGLISPPSRAIASSHWGSSLCMQASYVVTVRRFLDEGWTAQDIAMDGIRHNWFKEHCPDPQALSREEMVDLHARCTLAHAEQEATLAPKKKAFYAMTPEQVAPRYLQLQSHLLHALRQVRRPDQAH